MNFQMNFHTKVFQPNLLLLATALRPRIIQFSNTKTTHPTPFVKAYPRLQTEYID
jgi:hypothetical protein